MPPGSDWLVRATEGWSAGAWHCWHSSGGVLVSRALRKDPCAVWHSEQSSVTGACSQSRGPRLSAWQLKQVWLSVGLFSIATVVEPCALWQSLQPISPKRTGWVDGFWKSPRFCRWQLKHTSGSLLLTSTGSRSWCIRWQSPQATSLRSCVLACQPILRARLVAGEAGLVALLRRLRRARLEAVDRLRVLAGRVPGAGAVAGFALQAAGAERRALVVRCACLPLKIAAPE